MDWGCMSLDSSDRRWARNVRICARSGSAGSGMYQLYHGITDTKQPFPPLMNEFFFGGFLKHRTTMSYGTFDTSGLRGVGVAAGGLCGDSGVRNTAGVKLSDSLRP